MTLLSSKWFLSLAFLITLLLMLYLIGKKSVHHEIIVQATPEQVWAVLIDTQSYPDWNPVIVNTQGELVEGNKVTFTFQQDKDTQYDITATVKQMETAKHLNQTGGLSGILTYDHHYILKPFSESNRESTRVIIHEDYRGIGVPFWNPTSVEAAYARLNEALKNRVLQLKSEAK